MMRKAAYEALCDEIWKHNRLYFQEAAPIISDDEFDKLVLKLHEIETLHPEWVSPTSPSKRVGEAPLEEFPEVVHKKPMLSLEKGFTREDLEAFYERLQKLLDRRELTLFAQPKMDGIAVSIVYEHGHFIRAVTRGDGRMGSDISANCKTIAHLPLRIPSDFDYLEVRGEVFMPKRRFQEINEERAKEGSALFANPRNAAAGALKTLDSREVSKLGGLDIVFYGIADQMPHKVSFHSKMDAVLSHLSLPTFSAMPHLPLPLTTTVSSVDEMMDFQQRIHTIRSQLPFQIDGIVCKIDALDEFEGIASTSKHPRTAIAWKFGAEQAWTTLEGITVQVGRTGVITPVAELMPVELDGSTVRRATLHNMDEIERKDVRIHDRVLIEKGGDVIPKVVMVDTSHPGRGVRWKFPENCPSCGSALVHDPEEVAIRCPNRTECAEQQMKELAHFVGKDGFDIENVGEKLIRQLYDRGYIRAPEDLFLITKEQLLTLEGIKEKSASNILAGIEKAKSLRLEDFIMALGIRHIGRKAASDFAKLLRRVDRIGEVSGEELAEVEGFGEKTISSLLSVIKDPAFQRRIKVLLERGVKPQPVEGLSYIDANHPLYGKRVVVTGTLQTMTRAEALEALLRKGAMATDTVSKKTDYVVVGEAPGSKREKAMKLNVPVLSEEEFLKLLEPLMSQ